MEFLSAVATGIGALLGLATAVINLAAAIRSRSAQSSLDQRDHLRTSDRLVADRRSDKCGRAGLPQIAAPQQSHETGAEAVRALPLAPAVLSSLGANPYAGRSSTRGRGLHPSRAENGDED